MVAAGKADQHNSTSASLPAKKTVRFNLDKNTTHTWEMDNSALIAAKKRVNQENVRKEALPMKSPFNYEELPSTQTTPAAVAASRVDAQSLKPVIDSKKGYARIPDLPMFMEKPKRDSLPGTVPKEPDQVGYVPTEPQPDLTMPKALLEKPPSLVKPKPAAEPSLTETVIPLIPSNTTPKPIDVLPAITSSDSADDMDIDAMLEAAEIQTPATTPQQAAATPPTQAVTTPHAHIAPSPVPPLKAKPPKAPAQNAPPAAIAHPPPAGVAPPLQLASSQATATVAATLKPSPTPPVSQQSTKSTNKASKQAQPGLLSTSDPEKLKKMLQNPSEELVETMTHLISNLVKQKEVKQSVKSSVAPATDVISPTVPTNLTSVQTEVPMDTAETTESSSDDDCSRLVSESVKTQKVAVSSAKEHPDYTCNQVIKNTKVPLLPDPGPEEIEGTRVTLLPDPETFRASSNYLPSEPWSAITASSSSVSYAHTESASSPGWPLSSTSPGKQSMYHSHYQHGYSNIYPLPGFGSPVKQASEASQNNEQTKQVGQAADPGKGENNNAGNPPWFENNRPSASTSVPSADQQSLKSPIQTEPISVMENKTATVPTAFDKTIKDINLINLPKSLLQPQLGNSSERESAVNNPVSALPDLSNINLPTSLVKGSGSIVSEQQLKSSSSNVDKFEEKTESPVNKTDITLKVAVPLSAVRSKRASLDIEPTENKTPSESLALPALPTNIISKLPKSLVNPTAPAMSEDGHVSEAKDNQVNKPSENAVVSAAMQLPVSLVLTPAMRSRTSKDSEPIGLEKQTKNIGESGPTNLSDLSKAAAAFKLPRSLVLQKAVDSSKAVARHDNPTNTAVPEEVRKENDNPAIDGLDLLKGIKIPGSLIISADNKEVPRKSGSEALPKPADKSQKGVKRARLSPAGSAIRTSPLPKGYIACRSRSRSPSPRHARYRSPVRSHSPRQSISPRRRRSRSPKRSRSRSPWNSRFRSSRRIPSRSSSSSRSRSPRRNRSRSPRRSWSRSPKRSWSRSPRRGRSHTPPKSRRRQSSSPSRNKRRRNISPQSHYRNVFRRSRSRTPERRQRRSLSPSSKRVSRSSPTRYRRSPRRSSASPVRKRSPGSRSRADSPYSPRRKDSPYSPRRKDSPYSPKRKDSLHSPKRRDSTESLRRKDSSDGLRRKDSPLSPHGPSRLSPSASPHNKIRTDSPLVKSPTLNSSSKQSEKSASIGSSDKFDAGTPVDSSQTSLASSAPSASTSQSSTVAEKATDNARYGQLHYGLKFFRRPLSVCYVCSYKAQCVVFMDSYA